MKLDKHLKRIINQSLNECFKNGQINQTRLLHLVGYFKSLSSKSLSIALLEYCLDTVKRRVYQGTLRIESAVGLTDNQISQIKELITGRAFVYNVKVYVKPETIGGMRIQIGDKVMEDTIREKIEQIGAAIHG